MEMKGQVAIVTGGGSGIGREVCLRLAKHGAVVAVADIALTAAERVAGDVRSGGGDARAYQVDVSRSTDIQRVVQDVVARWRRIDILVNCAAVYQVGPIETISEEDWDRVLAVNLKGTFLFCKAVVPIMRQQGGGAIVNLASISGRTKSGFAAVNYTASKGGIIGLTMTLANQVAASGIRVNCVAPGTTDTPMINAVLAPGDKEKLRTGIPLGRLGRPEEIAAAVVFLASPDASFITGETLNVNGGAFMV